MSKVIQRTALLLFLRLVWPEISDAQSSVSGPIQEGEPLPDVQVTIHQGDSTFRKSLREFKGQLVIFDFWHINCGSCISSLPHMWDLQQKFEGKVKIVIVTSNTNVTLDSFWRKFKSSKRDVIVNAKNHLLSISEDTILCRLFPHESFPAHIWIDSGLRYLFVTQYNTTTAENIENVLAHRPAELQYQTRTILDPNHPLTWLSSGNNQFVEPNFYSFLAKRIEHGGPQDHAIQLIRDSMTHKIVGVEAINKSIFELYQFALNVREVESNYRTVFVGGDIESLFEPGDSKRQYEWWKANTFCYAMKIPRDSADDVRKLMMNDLERYFGMRISVVDMMVNCLVLKRNRGFSAIQKRGIAEGLDLTSDEGYKVFKKRPMGDLVEWIPMLLYETADCLPVVDETNYGGKLTVILPTPALPGGVSLKVMQSFLAKYGLTIEKGLRRMDMAVFSKN